MKIVFLCHFSSPSVRNKLELKSLSFDNFIRRVLHKPLLTQGDYASWTEPFIRVFERHPEFEFHIVSCHVGLTSKYQNYESEGVYYHFYNYSMSIADKLMDLVFGYQKKHNYPLFNNMVKHIVDSINPDLIVLLGAENPQYGYSILSIKDKPILVILQTLLNSPKRIEMNVGDEYRRKIENDIFKHANYFLVNSLQEGEYIKTLNPEALITQFHFPTALPQKYDVDKEFDFVYFAGSLSPNKGATDVVKAFCLLLKEFPEATLNMIGSSVPEYKQELEEYARRNNALSNIVFTPSFPNREDVFKQVQKSRITVVPGITAALNCTVRESMFLAMPTICYETNATIEINKTKRCLLTAPMENVEELSIIMKKAYLYDDTIREIACNGAEYAEVHYGIQSFEKILVDCFCNILNHHYE